MYVRPPLPPLSHPPGGRIQGGPHQGHRRRRRHCHEPDRAARLALKRCWRRQAHRRWLHPPSGGWRRHAKFGSAAGGGANRAGMPALADSPSRCTGRSCANAGCMLASLPAPVNRQNDLGALCHSAPLTGLKAPPPPPVGAVPVSQLFLYACRKHARTSRWLGAGRAALQLAPLTLPVVWRSTNPSACAFPLCSTARCCAFLPACPCLAFKLQVLAVVPSPLLCSFACLPACLTSVT